MAPVLFIYLMNAFVETLSKKWKFVKMKYKWLPRSRNRNKRGKLTGQSPKSKGSEFKLFYFFLYADEGAMLFDMREDLEEGTKLQFSHFAGPVWKYTLGWKVRNQKQNALTFLLLWTNNNQRISRTSKSSKVSSLSQTASKNI
jgi:hypothetical protein